MAVDARNQKYKNLLSMASWVEVGAFTGAAFGAAILSIIAIVVWYTLGTPVQLGLAREKSSLLLIMLPLVGLFCGAGAGILIAFGTGSFRNKAKARDIVEAKTSLKKGA
jgi:hypothetical protein